MPAEPGGLAGVYEADLSAEEHGEDYARLY